MEKQNESPLDEGKVIKDIAHQIVKEGNFGDGHPQEQFFTDVVIPTCIRYSSLQLKEKEEKIKELENEATERRADLQDLEDENKDLFNKNESQAMRIAMYKSVDDEIDTLQSQLDDAKKEIEELKIDNNSQRLNYRDFNQHKQVITINKITTCKH